jgi:lysine-N-methylase
MLITEPSYYRQFRCIAGDCPDSCCKEWEVRVDAETAARYRALPGDLGACLRAVLTDEEDGSAAMTITDGRCPMWRHDGLCRIQAQLGAEALCQVCRDFPRLRHDYGDFVELGLELSCPEAARLILTSTPGSPVRYEQPGGEAEYDAEAMEVLLHTRPQALSILEDRHFTVKESLALLLLYGYQAQSELDGSEPQPWNSQTALDEILQFAKPGDYPEIINFFKDLEVLTSDWPARLTSPEPGPWTDTHRALGRYFVERYWLQAVSDYDLVCRVKFAVIACLLIRHLGGDLLRTAQLFSKEIENNLDNVEAILDAVYCHPAFTDEKLLGLLLG